jgi:DNA-binding LytR/AlgR family response regulator
MERKGKWKFKHKALDKVLYFQSDNGSSLMVKYNKKQEVVDLPLIEVEKLLPPGTFCRVHRCYLVNINAISEFRYFRNQLLAVVHEYRIPVSRRNRKHLLDNLEIV